MGDKKFPGESALGALFGAIKSSLSSKQNQTLSTTIAGSSTVEGALQALEQSSGGTDDYSELDNKPKINGVELSGNKTASDLGINIPTNLSDLNDDSTHRTVSDTEKSAWNGKADTADITNAINALDVESVGGTGKYISEISEADGKISATAGTMDDAPTENSNAPVKSGGIKTAIDDSVSLKTATGNPITLTDVANANAEELSMTIEPIQSGSGDPSPTNVRPISGLTSGEVHTTNGTDTNTATITFGQTVYGGRVNFKSGIVTLTHKLTTVGALTWNTQVSAYANFISESLSAEIKRSDDDVVVKSDIYQSTYNSTPSPIPYCVYSNSRGFIKINDRRYSTVEEWLAVCSSTQICYELATPVTLTLTPAELELLKGNNTITANGAEISIKYYPDNAIGALAERVDHLDNTTSDMQEQIDSKANQTTVIIPAFTPSQAGWRRICKIKPYDMQIPEGMHTAEGVIYVGGHWSNGQPPSASIAVNIMNTFASLTLLSSAIGNTNDIRITDMRLVRASGAQYWLDVYFPAYSLNTGYFKLTFTGDIAVSDIQDPISITTDATVATAEVSLNQNVSGTVLTDKSGQITGDSWEMINIRDTSRVSCNRFTGTVSSFAMCGQYTGNAIIISLFVYITDANFTDIQTPSVKIEYPEYTNKARLYQLYGDAFGNDTSLSAIYQNRGENMWLDATKGAQYLTLTKQNFFKDAVNGVVVINIPYVIIPVAKN